MWSQGNLVAKVREGKAEDGKKYSDYFDFAEPFGKLKAHRVLAMFRAEKEEVLDLTLDPADEGFEPTASGLVRLLRAADRGGVRHPRRGPPRRQVADGHGPLGLAHPGPRPPRHRPADAAVAGRRGGGRRRLRRQPQGPAARRPGRAARHDGPRPGLPHRRQGRRRRLDRQGGRDPHDLPARPAPQVGRVPLHPEEPRGAARRRADRDRQRHRVAARPTSWPST